MCRASTPGLQQDHEAVLEADPALSVVLASKDSATSGHSYDTTLSPSRVRVGYLSTAASFRI